MSHAELDNQGNNSYTNTQNNTGESKQYIIGRQNTFGQGAGSLDGRL